MDEERSGMTGPIVSEESPNGSSDQVFKKELAAQAAEREFFGGETLDEAEMREKAAGDSTDALLGRISGDAEKAVSHEQTKIRENVGSLERAAGGNAEAAQVVERQKPKFDALIQRARQLKDQLVEMLRQLRPAQKETVILRPSKEATQVLPVVEEQPAAGSQEAVEAVQEISTMDIEDIEPMTPEQEVANAVQEVLEVLERAATEKVSESELLRLFTTIQLEVVPAFFRVYKPKQLHARLREGGEHPRFLMPVLVEQHDAMTAKQPLPPPEVVRAKLASPRIRAGYEALVGSFVPSEHKMESVRIARQLENRFFEDAAESALALAATIQESVRPEDVPSDFARQLREIALEAREAGREEKERYEQARKMQEELYETILAEPANAERRESIEARRLTERIFAEGEIEGELLAIDGNPYEGKGPAVATFKLGEETRKGVVKFEFMDRFTRQGVTPGSGPLREVVGTMGYVGLGFDAVPAVIARKMEDYGTVSVTEFISAKPANRKENWFLGEDGALHKDIERLAIADLITGRLDGADRNILISEAGGLVPIDFGSDISSHDAEFIRSAPLLAMEKLQKTVTHETQQQFLRWQDSKAREIFTNALDLLPEDQTKRKEQMNASIDAITDAFVRNPAEARLPMYKADMMMLPQQRVNDFGKRFMTDFAAYTKKRKEAAAPLPDKTAATPRQTA